MIKKIVAIGGGENGRFLEDGTQTLYETETIDEEIIKMVYIILNSKTVDTCHILFNCVK